MGHEADVRAGRFAVNDPRKDWKQALQPAAECISIERLAETLPPAERNILRLVLCDPGARARQVEWASVARFVVASFRADATRAGAARSVQAMVDELCERSADFAALWKEHDVHAYGEGTKHLRHPAAGTIAVEYSSFAVDGRPDLAMVVYNPLTPDDAGRIQQLIEASAGGD